MSISVEVRKVALIRDMFVNTADMNYVGARAAFFERRDHDFWWLTLHAVEKYLKAALLMNGGTANQPNHNLEVLVGRLQAIDGRLVPPPFTPPAGAQHGWFDHVNDNFLTSLNVFGSAANRYGAYSYVISDIDLFRADHLVYWARRHARTFRQAIPNGEEIDWIAALAASPRLWRHHSGARLERLADRSLSDQAGRSFARANVMFFPERKHRPLKARGGLAHNAPIYHCIEALRTSAAGSSDRMVAREVLEWTITHIHLPKAEIKEIKSLLAQHP